MVRDRSAFLDALKARLDQARALGERPVQDATPPGAAETPLEDLWEPEAGEPVAVENVPGGLDRAAMLGPGPDASPRRLAEARFKTGLWEPLAAEPAATDDDTTGSEDRAAARDRRRAPAPDPQDWPRSDPGDRQSSIVEEPRSRAEGVATPGGGGPDRPEPARPWSESGMPQRMREAIASVRRMSVGGSPDPRGRQPAHLGLREAPAPFGPRETPEPPDPHEAPEPSGPREAVEPLSPPETPRPPDPRDAPGPFSAREAAEPFSPHETVEPADPRYAPGLLGSRESMEPFSPRKAAEPPDPHDAPDPFGPREAVDPFDPWEAPEPFGSRDTMDSLDRRDPPKPLEREIPEQFSPPEQAAPWRVRKDETLPGSPAAGRRGIRIAAVVVAAAVVLLVGSGLGMMLAGWQIELPSPPAGTAAPPPAAESEAAPRTPPAITETLRVDRPATPPATAAERPPADLSATGAPLPPPPKPAASSVPGEASLTTEAADQAVQTLLREAGGPGDRLEPPIEEAGRLPAIRVFVHYTAGAAGGPATAMHLVRHLKAAGFAAEAQEVDYPIESDSIRYFFAADRDQAEALSLSLESQVPGGAAPPVVDFTRDDPKPEHGHLEVWIAA